MGRVPYRSPDPSIYADHYLQRGDGYGDFFSGRRIQKGYGNILGSLIRTGVPLLKRLVKTPIIRKIGKEALQTGAKVLEDLVVHKKPLKRSLQKRTADTIGRHVNAKVTEMAKRARVADLPKKKQIRDILDD